MSPDVVCLSLENCIMWGTELKRQDFCPLVHKLWLIDDNEVNIIILFTCRACSLKTGYNEPCTSITQIKSSTSQKANGKHQLDQNRICKTISSKIAWNKDVKWNQDNILKLRHYVRLVLHNWKTTTADPPGLHQRPCSWGGWRAGGSRHFRINMETRWNTPFVSMLADLWQTAWVKNENTERLVNRANPAAKPHIYTGSQCSRTPLGVM